MTASRDRAGRPKPAPTDVAGGKPPGPGEGARPRPEVPAPEHEDPRRAQLTMPAGQRGSYGTGTGRSPASASARRPGSCGSPAGRRCASRRRCCRARPASAVELLRIGLGKSQVEPDKGDKRFADPAWQRTLFTGR